MTKENATDVIRYIRDLGIAKAFHFTLKHRFIEQNIMMKRVSDQPPLR